MAITQITLTGTWTRPDGSPAQGSLSAALSEPIKNASEQVDPTPVAGVLDHSGRLINAATLGAFVLLANNDPATTPQGSVYEFVLQVDSAPVHEFSAVVPYNAAAQTIDVTALVAL